MMTNETPDAQTPETNETPDAQTPETNETPDAQTSDTSDAQASDAPDTFPNVIAFVVNASDDSDTPDAKMLQDKILEFVKVNNKCNLVMASRSGWYENLLMSLAFTGLDHRNAIEIVDETINVIKGSSSWSAS